MHETLITVAAWAVWAACSAGACALLAGIAHDRDYIGQACHWLARRRPLRLATITAFRAGRWLMETHK